MTTDTGDELTELMLQRGVAFVFKPQVSQCDDGSWHARYPGATWSVTGDTRDDALDHLGTTVLDNRGTDHETTWQITAVKEHLAHGPIPGVYEIPLAVNDDIMNSPNPQAALNDVIKTIDNARSTDTEGMP